MSEYWLKLRRIINYTIAFLSGVSALHVLYNLFVYPISIGRLLMYLFLLFPLVLIALDLGFNEALSRRLDRSLTRRKSLMIQAIIIIVVLVPLMFWGMSYANSLIKTTQQTPGIEEMYPEDIFSLWAAAVPIALYVIYYYAIKVYEYIGSKHKQNIK
ncbi:MAG: hypothetical protein J7L82_01295 [Staphylothermus sp.]|nr:hypothetical protein [Staphylothermus sp.]